MTRDEIRGLIGGYATGSLSAAERKALFEAVLDDQELFDELAREQALKELLDDPGVTPRLLAAVAPRRKSSWIRGWTGTWVWAAAGAFAVAVIAGIALYRTPPPQELARVIVPAMPSPPQPTISAPGASTPIVPRRIDPVPDAPEPRAPTPSAPPPAKQVAPVVQAPAQMAATPMPKVAPVPSPVEQTNDAFVVNGTVAGALTPGAGGGGGRGGGRGGAANRALARAPVAMAPAAPRFAFDYSVTPEGVLRITPMAQGFLTVSVNNATASTQLFSGRAVQAGSTTDVTLPADAVLANVIFSAQSETEASSVGALASAGIGGAVDPPAGTKSDPNPSPNSRLVAVIPVKR